MTPNIEELLARIRALQDEVEQQYAQLRAEYARRREALAERFLELQRRQKVGLWRYLRESRLSVVLTAPIIYSGWPVFALLDLFISCYQATCFPAYTASPKVRRRDYLTFDRTDPALPERDRRSSTVSAHTATGCWPMRARSPPAPSNTGARSSMRAGARRA